MNKFAIALAAFALPVAAYAADDSATVRTDVAAPVQVSAGKMLYGGNGLRLAAVYRVNSQGNPEVIVDGRLVTIPAATLSNTSGKLTTSLTKKDIAKAN